MPTKKPSEAEVAALRGEIDSHNYRYYVLAEPVVSDSGYDRLMRQLLDIEQLYPEYRSPDSPTQRVGASSKSTSEVVTHTVPLLYVVQVL